MNSRRIGAIPKTVLWAGLKGGIFDAKHTKAMGSAFWLFGYLCMGQTQLNERGEGLPRYGNPISREDISKDTGWSKKQIAHWTATLVRTGYIRVTRSGNDGLIFFIAKGKKKQRVTKSAQTSDRARRPESGRLDCKVACISGDAASRSPEIRPTQDANTLIQEPVPGLPTTLLSYSETPSLLQNTRAAKNAALMFSPDLEKLFGAMLKPALKREGLSQAQQAEREKLLARQREEIMAKYAPKEKAVAG